MKRRFGKKRTTSLDGVRTEVDSAWRDRLIWELISGFGGERAISKCVASGYPERTVRAAAESILSNPLFGIALLHTTRLKSRDWMFSVYAKLAKTGEGSSVDDRRELPSRDEFVEAYYARNRAVVLRGLAYDWPAVRLWPDPAYLSNACPNMDVEIMAGREAARISDQNAARHLRRRVAWAEYVNFLHNIPASNDYYIVARNQFFADPLAQILLNDIHTPPYVKLDNKGDDVRLWFGPSGTFTALHQDDMNILFVQVVGRKIVHMYAPYFAPSMQQSILWYAGIDPSATVDADVDVDDKSVETTTQLEPGDALFIPVGWWHSVRAMDVSMTLAFDNFGIPNHYPIVWSYSAAG